jgi:acyl carrier protein
MQAKESIRGFITTNFYVADASQLTDETSLLDSGIVDSTGVLEVIAFLERQFGIQVADEDMLPDNLDSIAKISAFVGRMKEKGAGH